MCSVKFSVQGTRLASASADKTCKVWDPQTGSLLATLQGHTKARLCSHLGCRLLSGNSEQHAAALQGVSDVAWHPTGKFLATASDDKTLKLWAANSGDCLRTLKGHTSYVFCCVFTPKGNVLASGSYDETLRLWNVTSGRCIKARLLLPGCSRPLIHCSSRGLHTQELPAHSDPITAIDFDAQGKLVASASYEGFCRIWDVETGACVQTIYGQETPPIGHVRFTPNGRFLLTVALDSTLRLWDHASGKCLRKYKGALALTDALSLA